METFEQVSQEAFFCRDKLRRNKERGILQPFHICIILRNIHVTWSKKEAQAIRLAGSQALGLFHVGEQFVYVLHINLRLVSLILQFQFRMLRIIFLRAQKEFRCISYSLFLKTTCGCVFSIFVLF